MAKSPPNLPEKGDRCTLRGGNRAGVVLTVDGDGRPYCRVKWDDADTIMLCHLWELVKFNAGYTVSNPKQKEAE